MFLDTSIAETATMSGPRMSELSYEPHDVSASGQRRLPQDVHRESTSRLDNRS